jgi:predicted transcriptional regulator
MYNPPKNDDAASIDALFADTPGWEEAVAESTARLKREQREYDDNLRLEVQAGVDQIARGETLSADEVRAARDKRRESRAAVEQGLGPIRPMPPDLLARMQALASGERVDHDAPTDGDVSLEAGREERQAMRDAIEQGLEDAREGRHQPLADAFAALRAREEGYAQLRDELLGAFASEEIARRWFFQERPPAFGGKTPAEVVLAGEIECVTGLLHNVNNGMFS